MSNYGFLDEKTGKELSEIKEAKREFLEKKKEDELNTNITDKNKDDFIPDLNLYKMLALPLIQHQFPTKKELEAESVEEMLTMMENNLNEMRRRFMSEDVKIEIKKEDEKEESNKDGLYGITEAPKEHPLNTSGNLKIITE